MLDKRTRRILRISGRRIRRLFAVLLAFGILGGGGVFLEGRVVQVPDGDTVVVASKEGLQRIRLYGVDCPELGQAGGAAAHAFTRSLAFLERVSVLAVDTDRYGRAVAVLTLADGRNINAELVRAGHAWVYGAYCKTPVCGQWRKLERLARAERLGLWRADDPEAPWKWRSRHRR